MAPSPTGILVSHPLADEILDCHRDRAAGDERGWASYRGHVYRVLNLARVLVPDRADRDDKLAVAAAFHDIDSFRTLNYLGPSIRTMTPGCSAPDAAPGPRSSRSSSPSTTA